MDIALLTSTIAPAPGVFALKRVDVKSRLEDYKKAFHFYCNCLKQSVFDKLIYIDNSGYDLEELINISIEKGVRSKIEFISYKSTIDVTNNSRFYLEINLIDYCILNSYFCKENPSCTIWKVTGRYLIKNISSIVSYSTPKKYDLYINHRNSPYKVIDFYLVGFSLAAYKRIFSENLSLYEGIRDGEIILREYLDSANLSDLKILRRFPFIPRIIGVRGFDGVRYGGTKSLTKFYLRVLANILFPFLWI